MHNSFSPFGFGSRSKRRGFTLIELLIVIAIILILIAIALPNFLEAQERARVTRAAGHLRTMETAVFEYLIQYDHLYADYNDPLGVKAESRNGSFDKINFPCPTSPPSIASDGGIDFTYVSQQTFYSPNLHCPLTTPIKFIEGSALSDPWSDGSVPVGMDSRYDTRGATGPGGSQFIQYSAYFVAGPDRVAGDWLRNLPRNTGCVVLGGINMGCPYSATNGTKSNGDFWFVVANNTAFAKAEYFPLNTFRK